MSGRISTGALAAAATGVASRASHSTGTGPGVGARPVAAVVALVAVVAAVAVTAVVVMVCPLRSISRLRISTLR